MSKLQRWLDSCGAGLLIVMVLAWPAVTFATSAGAAGGGAAAAGPNLRRGSPVWLGYLIMAVLMVVVVVISFMPSKRGHQD